MKFSVRINQRENLYRLSRKIDYHFQREENGEWVFTRALTESGFPRFHLYVKYNEREKQLDFKIHLDQKRAIYKGARAHSGEYDSEILKEEVGRIKKILEKESNYASLS